MKLGSRSPMGLCCLIVLAAFTGCTFNSQDLYRPLAPEGIPHKEEPLDRYLEAYAEAAARDSEALQRSLKKTHKAWDYFDIQKWDSPFASLDTERLLVALDSHEDNPFAWHMLAMYFAIQHRMDAAIDASQEGLQRISDLRRRGPSDPEALFGDLEVRTRINLALYHVAAGNHWTAIEVLEDIPEPQTLDPFSRLAFYWITSLAFSGAGDESAALAALGVAREISAEPTAAFESADELDYPQYSEAERREAMNRLLEGLIALDSERPRDAIGPLEAAAAQDPKNWDARLALASAYLLSGNVPAARETIERLAKDSPNKKLFRREKLEYNRGNIAYAAALEHLSREDDAKARETGRAELAAAEEHYLEAIEIVEGRSEKYLNKYRGALADRRETIHGRLLEKTLKPETFPAAQNNLGNVYRTRMNLAPDPERFDRLAQQRYERAIESTSATGGLLPRFNLARLHLERGRGREAFETMQSTLAASPESFDALWVLEEILEDTDDYELRLAAFGLLLDTLELHMVPAMEEPRVIRLLDALEPALANEPADAEWNLLRARIAGLRGENDRSKALLQEMGSALRPSVELARLALHEAATDAFRDYERELSEALENPPSGPTALIRDTHYIRGLLRLELGEDDAAREDFAMALELDESFPPAILFTELLDLDPR